MKNQHTLPVAIIGGGPIGLAAAAHLTLKEEPFILFEAGSSIGSNILEWGHVRMFSTWKYNLDKASRRLLEKTGWVAPNESSLPTGKDLVEKYLLPLSTITELKKNILLHAKVEGIAKKGLNKLKTVKRENSPFEIYVDVKGEQKVFEAKAVIDATGTWQSPNPSLSNGIWTKKEQELIEQIHYGIPDIVQEEDRYKNKTIMVVGSGHSAINSILYLAQLKKQFPQTKLYWVLRKQKVDEAYGGLETDELEARGELGKKMKKLVETNQLTVLTPFSIRELKKEGEKISVSGEWNSKEVVLHDIDELIVNTGFRPDRTFLDEIRIELDPAVESVKSLAPLIDPNIHSCGTVRPHGEQELRHPEKNFYIVGMKSYGRAPTFLLATGYEQVRSIVDYLTGDLESAKKIFLDLPKTGVCSSGIESTLKSTGCEIDVINQKNNSCCK
ncbi:NAD(P)-binding domain-containing protein [Bacillus weihaiensis]|uniref:Flavoprotein n=1 Tax=Bacillus weihaiensis TaxID=1547283 RepID=A0A1L3MRR7_9BACI|nr:NAD(P)-binding domain-containing protein [Bacillus weihaiensis]APH05026.1 flavoprotein [Bacillus weihaiensis]